MGTDPVHILNHDLYFTHTNQLLQLVAQRTGYPVFVQHYYYTEPQREILAPNGFRGWTVNTEEGLTLQKFFEQGEMMEFCLQGTSTHEFSFYINPHICYLSHNDFYMGRWSQVNNIANWIEKNGLPPPQYYENKSEHPFWFFQNRKKLYEYANRHFGSTQMLTFCDDRHQDWLRYFFEDNWNFDQFLEWGSRDFTLVKFNDLVNFSFPDDQPRYHNICILDDFSDLRQEKVSWKQPWTEVFFDVQLPETVSEAKVTEVLAQFISEAERWKLFVHAVREGFLLKMQVYFTPADFTTHLCIHFVQRFFQTTGYTIVPVKGF